jgi:peptide chain release factor 3
VQRLRDDIEMARGLMKPFDLAAYREGHLTPVFFGSAVNNFGVRRIAHGHGRDGAAAAPQKAASRMVEPTEEKVHGLRVQDPGEHGSEASRPHRLHAAVLRQVRRAA